MKNNGLFPLEEYYDNYYVAGLHDVSNSGMQVTSIPEIQSRFKVALDNVLTYPLEYTESAGLLRLRELIAKKYNVKSNQIIVTNGASEAMTIAYLLLKQKQVNRLLQVVPTYNTFENFTDLLGISQKYISINELKRLVNERNCHHSLQSVQALMLANPTNPHGIQMKEEEVRYLCDCCKSKEIFFILDEALQFANINCQIYEKMIKIGSISKIYGCPGLRIGWIVLYDNSAIETALYLKRCISCATSSLAQEIAIALLEREGIFIQRYEECVKKNQLALRGFIDRTKLLECDISINSLVCFPVFTKKVKMDKLLMKLRKKKFFIVPSTVFESNNGFRLGLGIDNQIFCEFLNAIERTIIECLEQ